MMRIEWHEGIGKLAKPQPAVLVLIIPHKEQFQLVLVRNNSELVDQTVSQFCHCKTTSTHRVEDSEAVKEIEIGMTRQL